MSLTASEHRALARIERVIQSRDPRLQEMFATFTRLTCQEALPAREQIRRRGWNPRPVIAAPLTLVLIVAIIAVGALGAASRACGPGRSAASGRPAAGAVSRWDHGCLARMASWPGTR